MRPMTYEQVFQNHTILRELYECCTPKQKERFDVKFSTACQKFLFDSKYLLKPSAQRDFDGHMLASWLLARRNPNVLLNSQVAINNEKGKRPITSVDLINEEVFRNIAEAILTWPLSEPLPLHPELYLLPEEHFLFNQQGEAGMSDAMLYDYLFKFRTSVQAMPADCFIFDSFGNLWFNKSSANVNQELMTMLVVLDSEQLPVFEPLSEMVSQLPLAWTLKVVKGKATKELLHQSFTDLNKAKNEAALQQAKQKQQIKMTLEGVMRALHQPFPFKNVAANKDSKSINNDAEPKVHIEMEESSPIRRACSTRQRRGAVDAFVSTERKSVSSVFAPIINGAELQKIFATDFTDTIYLNKIRHYKLSKVKSLLFNEIEESLLSELATCPSERQPLVLVKHFTHDETAYSVIAVVKDDALVHFQYILFHGGNEKIDELKAALPVYLKDDVNASFYCVKAVAEVVVLVKNCVTKLQPIIHEHSLEEDNPCFSALDGVD